MSTKHICFDRILPRDLKRPIRFMDMGGRSRAIAVASKLWLNGSTLRIRFLGGTAQQRQTVAQFAAEWTQHANLKLVFDNSADAEIRIDFQDDGAWSYIGTDAKGIPSNQATMNFGWLDRAVVLHEFGHAIGLGHEHSNPEGGLQWNEAAVISDLSGPPNNWDPETIRQNVFFKYRHDQIAGTEFDPESIMLYSFPAEWTTNGFHTEPNEVLSETDKAFVAGQKMYPRDAVVTDFVDLTVFEPKAIAASIGGPGEEDRFRFKVSSPGSYRVETEGPTDVVMKLFGPDLQTQLVAEDDDTGVGANARIDADLLPGNYFVQIRHWSPTATGTYGVKVLRI